MFGPGYLRSGLNTRVSQWCTYYLGVRSRAYPGLNTRVYSTSPCSRETSLYVRNTVWALAPTHDGLIGLKSAYPRPTVIGARISSGCSGVYKVGVFVSSHWWGQWTRLGCSVWALTPRLNTQLVRSFAYPRQTATRVFGLGTHPPDSTPHRSTVRLPKANGDLVFGPGATPDSTHSSR